MTTTMTTLQDVDEENILQQFTLNRPSPVNTSTVDINARDLTAEGHKSSQNSEPLSEPTSHILFDFLYHATGRKYLIDFTGTTGKVGYVLFWIEVSHDNELFGVIY